MRPQAMGDQAGERGADRKASSAEARPLRPGARGPRTPTPATPRLPMGPEVNEGETGGRLG